MVSASPDATLKVWDLRSGEVLRTLYGPGGGIADVTITPDGKTAVSTGVSASTDVLMLWDLHSGELLDMLYGDNAAATAVAITPDGKTAVWGSTGTSTALTIWNLPDGGVRQILKAHGSWISGVAVRFSPL